MDDIVRDFLIESKDNLDRLDQELVKLETDPTSTELLKSIFRTIHTIKGSCGFLGFSHLEKLAHAGENLLSKLRDRELRLNAEITSGLLAMVDVVRRILGEIETTEHDGDDEYTELIERLKKLQQAGNSRPETAVQVPLQASAALPLATEAAKVENSGESSAAVPQATPPSAEPAPKSAAATNSSAPAKKPRASHFRPFPRKIGGLLVERGAIRAEDLAVALQEQESGDRRRLGEILVALRLCRDPIVVIVNSSNPVDSLTMGDLKKIFLSERSRWDTGKAVAPVMVAAGAAERTAFLKAVCGMSDADFGKYFLQAAFTGKSATPPKEVGSSQALKGVVATSPGAIGFVKAGDFHRDGSDGGVKAVKVEGMAAGDAGYKLHM